MSFVTLHGVTGKMIVAFILALMLFTAWKCLSFILAVYSYDLGAAVPWIAKSQSTAAPLVFIVATIIGYARGWYDRTRRQTDTLKAPKPNWLERVSMCFGLLGLIALPHWWFG